MMAKVLMEEEELCPDYLTAYPRGLKSHVTM